MNYFATKHVHKQANKYVHYQTRLYRRDKWTNWHLLTSGATPWVSHLSS